MMILDNQSDFIPSSCCGPVSGQPSHARALNRFYGSVSFALQLKGLN